MFGVIFIVCLVVLMAYIIYSKNISNRFNSLRNEIKQEKKKFNAEIASFHYAENYGENADRMISSLSSSFNRIKSCGLKMGKLLDENPLYRMVHMPDDVDALAEVNEINKEIIPESFLALQQFIECINAGKQFNALRNEMEQEKKKFDAQFDSFYCAENYGKNTDQMISRLSSIFQKIESCGLQMSKSLSDNLLYHEPKYIEIFERIQKKEIPGYGARLHQFTELYSGLWKNSDLHLLLYAQPLFSSAPSEYGKINQPYYDAIQALDEKDIVKYLEKVPNFSKFSSILATEPYYKNVLEACVCYYGLKKNGSTAEFEPAKQLYECAFGVGSNNITWSGFYLKKKIGGEDAILGTIQKLVGNQKSANTCLSGPGTAYASCLMWMKAFRCEHAVLRAMLDKGIPMSKQEQDRLHALSNNAGNAPNHYEVQSDAKTLYFDVSALAWKETDYTALFENLAFQNKGLTYSIAVRDNSKDVLLPASLKTLSHAEIAEYIQKEFEKEYGEDVKVCSVNTVAISGAGEERTQGVLAITKACRQMGVLMYTTQIGKKLIIKFYTLFIPYEQNLNNQKQQALSLHHKLSATVNAWESSLQETMLRSVEKRLNAPEYGTGSNGSPDVSAPIF